MGEMNNAQILGAVMLTVVAVIALADTCIWLWRWRTRQLQPERARS